MSRGLIRQFTWQVMLKNIFFLLIDILVLKHYIYIFLIHLEQINILKLFRYKFISSIKFKGKLLFKKNWYPIILSKLHWFGNIYYYGNMRSLCSHVTRGKYGSPYCVSHCQNASLLDSGLCAPGATAGKHILHSLAS